MQGHTATTTLSQQCPTAEHHCNATVPNSRISLQRPIAKHLCSSPTAQYTFSSDPQSILAVPNRKLSPQRPSTQSPRSAQPHDILQCQHSCKPVKNPCSPNNTSKGSYVGLRTPVKSPEQILHALEGTLCGPREDPE